MLANIKEKMAEPLQSILSLNIHFKDKKTKRRKEKVALLASVVVPSFSNTHTHFISNLIFHCTYC